MTARERNLLLVLGGVVVVAAAVFLLTRGGGEPEEAAPTLPTPPQVAPPPEEPPPRPPRIPTFFAGRDPFVPLVIAAVEGEPTDEADGDVDGDDVGGPPVDGEEPIEPAPPGEPGEQPGVTVGGHTVVVIDVFVQNGEEQVQVEVDGDTFTVGEGDRFAKNFEVVSIQGKCATFLFGDETFTTCEGGRPK